MAELLLPDEQATWALGERLGQRATPGTVVAVIGTLGAGKTLFARAVGAGLGTPSRVSSPTFVVLAHHPGGRLELWHGDLYRLGDAEELDLLGLDEALDGSGVVLLEWAERFASVLPDDHLRLELHIEGDARRAVLHAGGPRSAALLELLLG